MTFDVPQYVEIKLFNFLVRKSCDLILLPTIVIASDSKLVFEAKI